MIILNQLQKRFSRSFAKIARVGSERPTKYIYLLIFIFIALFLQAYVHNYNIVYMALFFTFAFSVSSYSFGRNNIRALSVKLLSFERVFVNREASYTLLLSCDKERVYDISCYSMDAVVHIKRISSAQPEMLHFHHRYEKRGRYSLNEVRCESGFPLPHQIFYKVFDINKDFVVYPEPKGEPLAQYLLKSRALTGEQDDFEGIRTYEESDRLSQLHWPSLAKGQQMMSKEFSYTQEQHVLHFDFRSCAQRDEERLSQLCLWVLECEALQQHFSIAMDQEILSSKKMGHDEILEVLGTY